MSNQYSEPSQGEIHSRHRKVLNPAFSVSQLRQFLNLFQRSSVRVSVLLCPIAEPDLCNIVVQLADKLQYEELGNDGKVVNVTHWLPRATLDIIGESNEIVMISSVSFKLTTSANI